MASKTVAELEQDFKEYKEGIDQVIADLREEIKGPEGFPERGLKNQLAETKDGIRLQKEEIRLQKEEIRQQGETIEEIIRRLTMTGERFLVTVQDLVPEIDERTPGRVQVLLKLAVAYGQNVDMVEGDLKRDAQVLLKEAFEKERQGTQLLNNPTLISGDQVSNLGRESAKARRDSAEMLQISKALSESPVAAESVAKPPAPAEQAATALEETTVLTTEEVNGMLDGSGGLDRFTRGADSLPGEADNQEGVTVHLVEPEGPPHPKAPAWDASEVATPLEEDSLASAFTDRPIDKSRSSD